MYIAPWLFQFQQSKAARSFDGSQLHIKGGTQRASIAEY
jgi:hypothetical protein